MIFNGEQKLQFGLHKLKLCNYEIAKMKPIIKILKSGIIECGYPDIINPFLFKIATIIGYYYAKTHNYEQSIYWFKHAIQSTYDTDKSWTTFIKLLVPTFPTLNEEKQHWKKLNNNLDYLLKTKLSFNNLLIMDTSFYYGYYKYNPALILKKYTQIQRNVFSIISNNHINNNNKSYTNKIKVGFLSSGFNPFAKLDNELIHTSSLSDSFLPTILQLNKNKFDVTLIYYGCSKQPGTSDKDLYIPKVNPTQESIKQAQDNIKKLNLDVLVFTDLHIEPMINYIACSKLAHVQACTHGHPITSGLPKEVMNYFISWEAAELKNAQKNYTEELILLPKNIVWEYFIPRNRKINKNTWISERSNEKWYNYDRKKLDFLSNKCDINKNWYFCAQACFKFHALFDNMLKNILDTDKNGIIIMISIGELHNMNENLINRYKKNNLDLNRIIFINKLAHHQLMMMFNNSDVILDSYFFGGDTTTREAFEIGAPIVTLPSDYLGGRWTQAYYKLIGVTDLIASNAAEYVQLATKIATNKEYAKKIKNKILANKNKLFKSNEAITAWEDMLIKIHSNTVNKLTKESNTVIDIKDINGNKINTDKHENNNILFSCTTFLKNDKKYEILIRALDTFIKYNKEDLYLINEFLILMEYTDNNKLYLDKLRKKYPAFTFINKNENQKGHSKSINMIIDNLSDYKYWLHWEDSWYSIGSIVKKAYDIISNTKVNNLQFTERDVLYKMPQINNEFLECKFKQDFKMIKANDKLKDIWRDWEMNCMDWSVWKKFGLWPFYSLRPSIIDVSTVLKSGYHNEDYDKWPFQCEFEWSLKWVRRNNIVIGIMKDIYVIRDSDHESTYDINNYNRWLKKLNTRECKENYNRNVKYYTLKSDKLKIIIFWNPYCGSTILKKFIFHIEEGFSYNGKNIHEELGDYNFNKYFVEFNLETQKKYSDYEKILFYRNPVQRYISFCNKNGINNYYEFINNNLLYNLPSQTEYINKVWLDRIIDVKNINSFISKYISISYNKNIITMNDDKLEKKIKEIYKIDFNFLFSSIRNIDLK